MGDVGEIIPSFYLVKKHLFRELLPLLQSRFLRFREKHANNREGFIMELKRLNVMDENEMRIMTHAYFLTKVPTLVWLIEWTLTIYMRQVFSAYEWHEPFPYVIVDPYVFLGHLFQCIASQWLMLLQDTNAKEMTIHELDKFLKTCLQEHLERNVPIVPHNSVRRTSRAEDWYQEMKHVHDRLWNSFTDIRPYIPYHKKWFSDHDASSSSSSSSSSNSSTSSGGKMDHSSARELRLLHKAIVELTSFIQKMKVDPPPVPPAPPAPPAPVPAAPLALPAAPVALPAAPVADVRKRAAPSPSLSSEDDDAFSKSNTITAKIASSSSSSDDDEPDNRSRRRRQKSHYEQQNDDSSSDSDR